VAQRPSLLERRAPEPADRQSLPPLPGPNSAVWTRGPGGGGRGRPPPRGAPSFPPPPGSPPAVDGQRGGAIDAPPLPDLVDAWGQPIGFMRRIRPLGTLVRSPGASDTAQFDPTGLLPYVTADRIGRLAKLQEYSASGNVEGSVLTGLEDEPEARDNLARLIRNPAFDDQARGTFVLMSAGPDGIYFSAADGPGTRTEPVVDLLDEDLDLPDDVAGEYDDLLTFGGS